MQSPVFRFGDFLLDPAARVLWHRGQRVSLPPKSLECLAYLLQNRQRAVGRDELISAVWGRADVNDALLAQTLWRARRVLGDTASEQSAIRTVPRFGYQWVAAVEVVDAAESQTGAEAAPAAEAAAAPASESAPDAAEPIERAALPVAPGPVASAPAPPAARNRRLALVALVAALVLAAFGMAAWRLWPAAPPVASAGHDAFLVLPVSVADKSAESAWIRLGAMDYIASRLREEGGAQVVPSDQVVHLVGPRDDIDERSAADLRRLELVTGATRIIVPRAGRTGDEWRFALDVYRDGGIRSFEAHAGSPLQAAALATARLMDEAGLVPATAPAPLPANEILQQVDAAILAGEFAKARSLIEAAPEGSRNDPQFRVRAGRIAQRTGRPDLAEQIFRPLTGDDAMLAPVIRAQAFIGLGAAAVSRQDYPTAVGDYSKAIDLLGERGDPRLRGRAYLERGVAEASQARFDPAMSDYAHARSDLERADDRIGIANLDINVGVAEAYRTRYNESIAAYDRAIPVLTRFGVRDKLVLALFNKLYIQLAVLDAAGALVTSERAMDLARQQENPGLLDAVSVARARALLANGRLTEAAGVLERPGVQEVPVNVALARILLLRERGDDAAVAAQAHALLARIAAAKDPGSRTFASEAAQFEVEALLRLGRTEQAEGVLAAFKAQPEWALDTGRAPIVAMLRAETAAARGQPDAAALFNAAMAAADARATPDLQAAVAIACAHALVQGHLPASLAPEIAGRLSPLAPHDYRSAQAAAALYRFLGETRLADEAQTQAKSLAGERDPKVP